MRETLIRFGVVTGAVSLTFCLGDSAHALSLVTTRSALNSNDVVEWSQLGANSTSVASPFNATSEGGVQIEGSIPTGTIERRDQGIGWAGNFAAGEALLWTNDNSGPLTFSFSETVLGAGLQIQRDFYGTFTASIEAFNGFGNSLGEFTVTGESTDNQDDSALFIGVTNDTATIASIVLDILADTNDDFAVGQLNLKTVEEPVHPIPTPALLPGLIGMGVAALRKKKSHSDNAA